jgi:hypothetical protein
MKSISDREVIYHKPLKDVNEMTFDITKKPKKKPKNRQPIKGQEVSRRSTLSIRLGLKEFCTQFLENCYNPLMYAVKVNIIQLKKKELYVEMIVSVSGEPHGWCDGLCFWVMLIVGFSHGRFKPKTMKLVFAASPLSMQRLGVLESG